MFNKRKNKTRKNTGLIPNNLDDIEPYMFLVAVKEPIEHSNALEFMTVSSFTAPYTEVKKKAIYRSLKSITDTLSRELSTTEEA